MSVLSWPDQTAGWPFSTKFLITVKGSRELGKSQIGFATRKFHKS